MLRSARGYDRKVETCTGKGRKSGEDEKRLRKGDGEEEGETGFSWPRAMWHLARDLSIGLITLRTDHGMITSQARDHESDVTTQMRLRTSGRSR